MSLTLIYWGIMGKSWQSTGKFLCMPSPATRQRRMVDIRH